MIQSMILGIAVITGLREPCCICWIQTIPLRIGSESLFIVRSIKLISIQSGSCSYNSAFRPGVGGDIALSVPFQMQASPSVSLPDPLGSVKSQVMEVVDHPLAMTLNSILAEKTVVGQIQSRYRGSGVNHIARNERHLCLGKISGATGTEVTEVTGHYYDDLAPRFGLSAELITQLRTQHILYDEDEADISINSTLLV